MNSGVLKTNRWLLVFSLLVGIFFAYFLLSAKPALAATGINQEINFQGRLLNAQGATVPDGYYNIEFKIYQDGDGQSVGDTTGSPAGSLKWTEDYLNANSQGVEVVNGYLSVELGSINPFGSSINWNESTLWLSMNIGSTNATCTPFSSCTPDGEMIPMQPLTSAVYALNSNALDGITASSFGQLANNQTWTGTNLIQPTTNITGLAVLQTSAASPTADIFDVQGTGGSSDNFIQVTSTAANQGAVNISSLGSNAVTLTAGTASETLNGNGTFKDSGNSATAFQFENAAGSNILGVDTLNNQVVLGKVGSSGQNGQILFNTATAGNYTAQLGTSASQTASYSLTLPLAGPTATQCLQSGPSTPSQLVFATCDPNGPAILNQVFVQPANFYVQAATSGTVAGVLEANSAGSGDILDLKNGSGTTVDSFSSTGDVAISQSTYTSNQVVIGDGLTGTPPAYPNSYTPALTVQTNETTGSRPLFFGYNNGGTWAATLTTGACGSFSVMCLDLGSGSAMYTGLSGNGTTLDIAGGADGNFTNVQFENSGDVGIGMSPSHTLDVAGIINTTTGYDINGTPIASSNLSDSSNLAKLNGTQTFTATNTFQPTTNITGLAVLQTSAASPTADIFDVQGTGGSSDNFIQVTSTAANQGAVNISSLGSNAVTLTGGSNVALVSGTVYIGGPSTTYSTSSTSDIGYTSGATGTQIVNIGSSANAADSVSVASGTTGGISLNGNITSSGTYNTNALTSTTLTFGGTNPVISSNTSNTNSSMTLQANGTGSLSLNTTGAGAVDLGTANSTTIDVGNTTAATSTLIQGGTGTTALSLQVGAGGTIAIGATGSLSNATTVNIGTSTGAAQAVTAGSTNSGSTVNIVSGATSNSLSNTGDIIATSSNSPTAFEIQNSSTYSILNADTTNGQVVLGTSNHLNGKLVFNTTSGGTVTINPTSSATSYILTLPAETGTVCTTAATGVCNTSDGLNNVAYLNATQTFTGTNKFAPTTNINSAIVKQSSVASPTADIFDVQGTNGTSNFLQVTSTSANAGAINITSFGSSNPITLQSGSGTVSLGTSTNLSDTGALTVTAGGASALNLNTTGAGTVNLGTANSTTIGVGNTNAAVTTLIEGGTGSSALSLQVGSGGTISVGTTSQTSALNLGNTSTSTTTLLNGGTGATAIQLTQGTGGGIVIGSTGTGSTVSIQCGAGTSSSCGFGNNATDHSTTIGSTTGTSLTTIQGGTGGISLNGNTIVTSGHSLTVDGSATFQDPTNSSTAFLIQNSSPYNLLAVDTSGDQLKVFDGTATQAYVSIAYNDGTSTGTIAASSGTTAIGNGTGPINITPGSGSAVTITANAASTWTTSAGLLTIQGNGGLTLNSVGTNTLNLDSTTTGSVNLGTNANGKAIQIGNNQNATTVDVTAGNGSSAVSIQAATSGSILIGTSNANSLTVGSTNAASQLTLEGGSGSTSIELLSAGNVTINSTTAAAALLVLSNDTNATYNQGQATSAPTEVDGAMFYSTNNNDFLCGVGGAWETCTGLLYSNTAASTAINTCTTACTAFSTSYASTIPANYCEAGRTIRIEASGIYSTYSSGSPTLAFGIYYGTSTTKTSDTQIGTSTPTTAVLANSLTNNAWTLNYTVICYSTSSMSAEGTLVLQDSNTTTTSDITLTSLNTAPTTGLTTTSAKNFYIFPTWGASNASDTITAEQVIISGE